jgi:hypothetical protein
MIVWFHRRPNAKRLTPKSKRAARNYVDPMRIGHQHDQLRADHNRQQLVTTRTKRGSQLSIVLNKTFEEDAATVFREGCRLGSGGIVSKRLGSIYRKSVAISPELRERFEFYGERLMTLAIESGDSNRIGSELADLGQHKRRESVAPRTP